uniref:Uncharacterized protein n=1 Tax=Ditylum brightwellii TaxID=49249 RepID=A0A7S2EPL6_9STRA|mmetsp:Transcript_38704/g.58115  ORF Transcript_38704/g.58115 Transcript_38704/m.58115 type:complete len:215 (+) Transcript_38704:66-710(+)
MTMAAHQPRQSVRFHHATNVMFVKPHCQMLRKEKKATWYSKEEQMKMKIDALETVCSCRAGQKTDETNNTTRGLEHVISADAQKHRLELRHSITLAVLEEQRHQRDSGIFDPECISDLSCSLSLRSRVNAMEAGATDAAAAVLVHCHEIDNLSKSLPPQSEKDRCILEHYHTDRNNHGHAVNTCPRRTILRFPDIIDSKRLIKSDLSPQSDSPR